jgi:hypothetical protein
VSVRYAGGVAGAEPRGAIVASRSASAIAEIRPDGLLDLCWCWLGWVGGLGLYLVVLRVAVLDTTRMLLDECNSGRVYWIPALPIEDSIRHHTLDTVTLLFSFPRPFRPSVPLLTVLPSCSLAILHTLPPPLYQHKHQC